MKKNKGFTLVELVIVLAVISILLAILIPTMGNIIDSAKEAKKQADLKAAYTEYIAQNSQDENKTFDINELVFKYTDEKYYVMDESGEFVEKEKFDPADEEYQDSFTYNKITIYTTKGEAE